MCILSDPKSSGDSGYPLEPSIMTPAPDIAGNEAYNNRHAKGRNVIERTFGVLKARFRCLHKSGGDLEYQPGKVCKFITACCILHNVSREADGRFGGEEYDSEDDDPSTGML